MIYVGTSVGLEVYDTDGSPVTTITTWGACTDVKKHTNGYIYASFSDGFFRKLDPNNSYSMVWEYGTFTDTTFEITFDGNGNPVLGTSFGGVDKLDDADGTQIWSVSTDIDSVPSLSRNHDANKYYASGVEGSNRVNNVVAITDDGFLDWGDAINEFSGRETIDAIVYDGKNETYDTFTLTTDNESIESWKYQNGNLSRLDFYGSVGSVYTRGDIDQEYNVLMGGSNGLVEVPQTFDSYNVKYTDKAANDVDTNVNNEYFAVEYVSDELYMVDDTGTLVWTTTTGGNPRSIEVTEDYDAFPNADAWVESVTEAIAATQIEGVGTMNTTSLLEFVGASQFSATGLTNDGILSAFNLSASQPSVTASMGAPDLANILPVEAIQAVVSASQNDATVDVFLNADYATVNTVMNTTGISLTQFLDANQFVATGEMNDAPVSLYLNTSPTTVSTTTLNGIVTIVRTQNLGESNDAEISATINYVE